MDWQTFFKDYGEYIVGIPFGILALCLAYFIFQQQQSKKDLTFQVLSNYRLITVDSNFQNQFKILFKDEEVGNVNLVILKFKNTGNTPIEKKDFERPVKINFMSDSNIILGEILEQNPENLGIEIVIDKGFIEISPCLLNQSDFFSIQMLISGNKVDYSVDGRVSGIKKISELQAKNNWIGCGFSVGIFVILISGMVAAIISKKSDTFSVTAVIAFVIALFIAGTLAGGFFSSLIIDKLFIKEKE